MPSSLSLLDFVHLLHQRQQNLLARLPETSPVALELQRIGPSLSLAQAALEKQALIERQADLPLQIAVVGPTQAGKSSVVNWILKQEAAGVSPLAGYTIHPQAFLHDLHDPVVPWVDEYFKGYRRLDITDLPKDRYDCFGIRRVESSSALPSCIVWDTPDFDSLRARQYLEGVLRTAALADVSILVVSKDKYADQSVWDLLTLIEPLAQPTLVCLNKLRPSNRETLLKSWQEKWDQVRQDGSPPVVTLAYYEHLEDLQGASDQLHETLASPLRRALKARRRQGQRTRTLMRRHWPAWTRPVRAELAAEQSWQEMINGALGQALEIYRHDYLDHPLAYETFQRALAELLTLLEIPGLARPMMLFRKAVTWPVKALFKRRPGRGGENIQELLILRRSVEHALLQLQAALREQAHSDGLMEHWWQELSRHYQAAQPALNTLFEEEASAYYRAFQPQVEAAAQSLYQRLKEMPATLNSLRAARATADAAGLALLFQTGGIGPHDFVLAPAVLSMTSLMAESALGKYMDRVSADLKRTQLEAVKRLLQNRLRREIASVAEQVDPAIRFRIPEETLAQVEAQLKEKSYGLKLF
ncbi:MAG: hypothetical protein Kow0060_15450 [Methylohalobius crimeensis]